MRLEVESGRGLPDWRVAVERRAGRVLVVENEPLAKEAVYQTGKLPPEHQHHDDDGAQCVVIFDLHGTLTPARGFPLSDPYPGVKETLDLLASQNVCLHIATGALSPDHFPEILEARRRLIDAWLVEFALPISFVTGKVAAHVYLDDRMVRVPPGGDWPQVSAAIADRLSARGQLVDGQWRLVALPETGAAIEDFPELDEVPPDQPRGYSTPVLDVDVHRCLLEASSSSNDSGVAKGALEVLRAVWGLDYQIHLSCAGFDPAAKTPEQSAERLAGLRMTARREGIPYDLFVAKNHGTVFVDDKGLRFEDWSAQAAEILARLAAPDPEDEVTSLVPDAAGTAKAVLRKAVETPPTDTHLERAEAHYADVIAKGLSLGLDIRKVTSKWLRSRTTGKAVQNEPPEVAHARAYLQSAGLDTAEVEAALTVLYRDGYMLGQHRAASGLRQVGQQITSQVSAIDWSTWAPGHPAAADALAGPGLRSLLDQSQVTIKSIADTQIDELASRLAQGAANGDSVDTIARGIEDLAGSRGEMIAQTELARAVSSATRDSYVANGVESFDWLAEADACPECDQMAAEGPYDPFQDDMPPLHPRCRCSASPHMLTEEDQAMKARALELSILAKIAERLDQSESTKSSPTLERALEAVKAANERPINITVQPAETHIHEGAVKVEITHQAPGSVTEMEYDRDGRPTRIRRQ